MRDQYEPPSNPSTNDTFAELVHRLLDADLERRQLLTRAVRGGLGLAAISLFGGGLTACSDGGSASPTAANAPVGSGGPTGPLPFEFTGIQSSTVDEVKVPAGYTARVLYAWGDPIGATGMAVGTPAFKADASNTAEEQALQAGMHHDGMQFFPLPAGSSSSSWGLLAVNHEYTDDGLLHPGGFTPWTAEKVTKSQYAHGVSVVEVELTNNAWSVVRPSQFARRITARTPMRLAGPAAGADAMKTADDATGQSVLGTVNNCANGFTPWGTYLTCEENWNGYFVNATTPIPADQARYGISKDGGGYRWHEHDRRFDAHANPNEPNRFGWVVEIDPYDPQSVPVKRTALGRIKHEGATVTVAADNRVVVYMGDDERFEYIYKFVSKKPWNPLVRGANADVLDEGTLYVAKFNADGTGTWLELSHAKNNLVAANGFQSQADICIKTRQAADQAGATKMDRPEWIAVHPTTKDVYVTLTNNSQRGTTGKPGVDAANPRPTNTFGHIVRWMETNSDPAATTFAWNVFLLCGDPANADANKKGNLKGDIFGSPDGLAFDPRGILWIQTDVSTSVLGTGDYATIGNNQMLACDIASGTTRRFLTGPKGCEITGITFTNDQRNLFINIQHPGETASERSDPAQPKAISSWPDGQTGGRPRAATVVIRRNDGGLIGT
ncbi:MAG: PhoX family phosphatase [Nitrospiraceae bacterium]